MDKLENLIDKVNLVREILISEVSGLTQLQSYFKPSDDEWSVTENIEHLVWAEKGGLNGIWKAFEGIKNNCPVWSGENVNHGLTIEEIVDKTWQKKEKVPESAKPKWGGPLKFWIESLKNCKYLLQSLDKELAGMDIEQIIHPHPISGPLNVPQRMEFLRFHMERHQHQIENIKAHPDFPKN